MRTLGLIARQAHRLLLPFLLSAPAKRQPWRKTLRPQTNPHSPHRQAPPSRRHRLSRSPAEAEWTMPGANVGLTRFSNLSEINSDNVRNLQAAFSFSMGVDRGQEAAPLVVGDTLYVVGPYPNVLYALDISKPGGPLKWKYEPKPLAASRRASPVAMWSIAAPCTPTGDCSSIRSTPSPSP